MDRNFLLAVVLSMLVVTVWTSTRPKPEDSPLATVPSESTSASVDQGGDAAGTATDAGPYEAGGRGATLPQDEPGAAAEPAGGVEAIGSAALAEAPPTAPAQTKRIEGTNFVAELTNRGAAITSYALLDYGTGPGKGVEEPIDLIARKDVAVRVGTTPFPELGIGDLRNASFEVESEDGRSITYAYTRGGITVRKHYRFDLDDHTFEMSVAVENTSGDVLHPEFAIEWPAAIREGNDYKDLSLLTRHDGDVDRTPVKSVGSSGFFGFGGDDGRPKTGGVDWFGVDTTYFVGVLAPQRGSDAQARYVPFRKGEVAANVLGFEGITLPSGNRITQELRGYIGPKVDERLEAFGADLVRSIDRGWSWVQPLTRFFAWLLRTMHGFIPNYGWVIILLTVMVRVATLPIVQRQMHSMEKMRAVQPRMKEIQEKYADDREKQSQAMMSLYKEEGVNPLGGCLPMVLQLPVFIGLFYALRSSIELRHAPFIFWMTDLSAPEQLFLIPGVDLPFRVLPILMAGSMILQAKLQPMSPDPAQAQMMTTVMPIMMLVLFYQFPSGLVLYYMLSNLLGIAHQRWVGRNMKKAEAT
jgi:YidC/Oxa1 family membrane protein insertase